LGQEGEKKTTGKV